MATFRLRTFAGKSDLKPVRSFLLNKVNRCTMLKSLPMQLALITLCGYASILHRGQFQVLVFCHVVYSEANTSRSYLVMTKEP